MESVNLIDVVPAVPSLSLNLIVAVPVTLSPLKPVISIVEVDGVVSETVTPVTLEILY